MTEREAKQRGQSILLILCLLVMLAVGAGQAVGSSPGGRLEVEATRVEFDPSYREFLDEQVETVEVMVRDVVNLYGYELHLSFNPSVLQVVDVDPDEPGVNVAAGDFLSATFVATNIADNTTGQIDFATTQIGGAPQSGEGQLIAVTFRAVGTGEAQIEFDELLLSDHQSFAISADAIAPVYVVLGDTPTPGASSTPTRTTTPTRTPTATATLTGTMSTLPYYYLAPQVLEVGPGETAQVAIRTSYVQGLGGVSIYLRWDPDLIEVVDADPAMPDVQVAPGDLFAGLNTFRPPNGNLADNLTGDLQYALVLTTDPDGVDGQWTVATITFRAKGLGACDLAFYGDTLMASPQTGNIASTWIDGDVFVVEATSTPTQTPTATATSEPTIPLPTIPLPTIPPPTVPLPTVPAPTETPTSEPTVPLPTATPWWDHELYIPLVLKTSPAE